ncbi:hypothetical protein D3C80_1138390 [compost metagenome]
MLELTLAQPQHQTGTDHRRAGDTEEEVQPAQPGAGEHAHVQAVHTAGNHHRDSFGFAVVLQRAIDAIEHPATTTLIGNAITAMPGETHAGILITRVLHFDPAVATARRLFLERLVKRWQRQQRRGNTGHLDLFGRTEQIIEVSPGVIAIAGNDAGRHHQRHEDHQAAVADHQVKRQHQHANGVMPVEPGTLALARTESEELLEDLLVGDDPGHQAQEHDERGKGRQPAAPGVRHLQLEVEAVEKIAATGLARLQFGAGGRVEGFGSKVAAPATGLRPAHAQRRFAGIGQLDEPAARRRRMLLQVALGQVQARRRVQRSAGHFRLRPVTDFFLEIGHGPGHENRKQQPAENQPGPGMQPGHGLAKALFHGFFIQ